MELVIAFVVLVAGAVLALRSATSPPPDRAEEAPFPETEIVAAIPPEAAAEEQPNGEAALEGTESVSVPDSDDTVTAPAIPIEHRQPASGAVAVRFEPIAITEDRALDDVLIAAAENAEESSHPAVRLLAAIAGLALAFAAAIMLVVRGIQFLWGRFFGG